VRNREVRRLEAIRALGASDAAERFMSPRRRNSSAGAALSSPSAQLVPVRRCCAPLTFSRIPRQERAFPSPLWNAYLNAALYWANGTRTVAEIERLASLECGSTPVDLPAWFLFLAAHGYVELRSDPDGM
jgi:hypothetical protein